MARAAACAWRGVHRRAAPGRRVSWSDGVPSPISPGRPSRRPPEDAPGPLDGPGLARRRGPAWPAGHGATAVTIRVVVADDQPLLRNRLQGPHRDGGPTWRWSGKAGRRPGKAVAAGQGGPRPTSCSWTSAMPGTRRHRPPPGFITADEDLAGVRRADPHHVRDRRVRLRGAAGGGKRLSLGKERGSGRAAQTRSAPSAGGDAPAFPGRDPGA